MTVDSGGGGTTGGATAGGAGASASGGAGSGGTARGGASGGPGPAGAIGQAGAGAAGTSGNAGAGAAGSGGAAGATGSAGAGGAVGGIAGRAGNGGAGGRGGGAASSGASGAAGSGGRGGNSGAAGAAGRGGSAGAMAFPFRPAYILGADITYTLEDEARGERYVEAGVTKSIERIFANNGFNYIRLRTFVNPRYRCASNPCASGESNGYNAQGFGDTAHTIAMAKRVKACRMGIFLDFHMSDTWASIGYQYKPQAWEGLSASQLQQTAYAYVKDTLDQMVAAGVKPDMVQVGNETNSRMSEVSMSNWGEFSGLVNAGIRAVRDTDTSIIVWAQHGRPRPDGGFSAWVDDYLANSPAINVDGICGSTYGTTNNGDDWRQEFGRVISMYNKPVMSCEYTNERRTLINPIMRAFAGGMGRGTFLWEPTRYPALNDNTLFSHSGTTFTANSTMALYADLARSYGLPVPATPAAELDATTCR